MTAIWREDLQASVVSLRYNFTGRVGTLVMPPECCTDMRGVIALFTAIDPHVQCIDTVAGGRHDTSYTRTRRGWVARPAADARRAS
jgi:hypothetical protein